MAGQQVVQVGIIGELVGAGVGQQGGVIGGAGEPVVDRQGGEGIGRDDGSAFGIDGQGVVDEEGEVFAWIVFGGHADGGACEVGGGDPVADEGAVGLGGDDRGEDAIAGGVTWERAVVDHGGGQPIGGVFEGRVRWQRTPGIGQDLAVGERQGGWDKTTGGADLVVDLNGAYALGVSDFGGHGDGLP